MAVGDAMPKRSLVVDFVSFAAANHDFRCLSTQKRQRNASTRPQTSLAVTLRAPEAYRATPAREEELQEPQVQARGAPNASDGEA